MLIVERRSSEQTDSVKTGVLPADCTLADTLAHIVLASPALPLTHDELGESSKVSGRSY